MPYTKIHWTWEEAFDKFGFGDGDGLNMTHEVAWAIQHACDQRKKEYPKGVDVHTDTWGIHNYMIMDITDKATGKSIYKPHPDEGGEWQIGYDDPQCYLPDWIVAMLDKEFADEPESKETHA